MRGCGCEEGGGGVGVRVCRWLWHGRLTNSVWVCGCVGVSRVMARQTDKLCLRAGACVCVWVRVRVCACAYGVCVCHRFYEQKSDNGHKRYVVFRNKNCV